MIITLYLHSNKEYSYEKAQNAGIVKEEALDKAMYIGYEHKMEYEVNKETGDAVLVRVDGRTLSPSPEL